MDILKHGFKSLPYSNGRYSLLEDGSLFDSLKDETVLPLDGHYYLDHPLFDSLSEDELWMLTHKPLQMDVLDFCKSYENSEIQFIRNEKRPLGRLNGFWKFKVESSYYKGYYYIPGFTSYVMNVDGDIISTVTGRRMSIHVANTGYPSVRLNRDDGASIVCLLHRLKAFTFLDWDVDVLDLEVDHDDGNRLNHDVSNLIWVTRSTNMLKANASNFYGKGTFNDNTRRLFYHDLKTSNEGVVKNIIDLVDILGINRTTIYEHLRKQFTNRVIKGRYIVCECDVDVDGNVKNKAEILSRTYNLRDGSQPREVISKNVSTGEVKHFSSVVEFLEYSGLTKKQVYSNLALSKQKVYGDIVFKYEDDEADWII